MEQGFLALENIEKTFISRKEQTEVLKKINLTVQKGEFITLLGSSGCGKTTTLRIIAGLEQATAGHVFLEGQEIDQLPPEKRNVNTVFQNYALFPNMTVGANVAYGLKIRKTPKAEIQKRVKETLELVQLPEYIDRYPEELSGGQKQRVAIARALINAPKVLLLDEPLGALDLKLRRQMQLELKRLQKKLGITFIYITHDQEEAINMSDRIAVMHNGQFEQIGTPNEIYYEPKTSYIANFIGNANLYQVEARTCAIRPENVLFEDTQEDLKKSFMETREKSGNQASELFYQNAVVLEKSFAGGQLRILFELGNQQKITATRSGINSPLEIGQQVVIGWDKTEAVEVLDNGI